MAGKGGYSGPTPTGKKARAHRALDCGCTLSCHPQRTQAAATRVLVVEGGKLSAPICSVLCESKFQVASIHDGLFVDAYAFWLLPSSRSRLPGRPRVGVCRLRAVDANQHDNYTHIESSFENADVVSLALSSFRVLPGNSLRRPSSTSMRACALRTRALVCHHPRDRRNIDPCQAQRPLPRCYDPLPSPSTAPPRAETCLPPC